MGFYLRQYRGRKADRLSPPFYEAEEFEKSFVGARQTTQEGLFLWVDHTQNPT